jgi:hypothetical protein
MSSSAVSAHCADQYAASQVPAAIGVAASKA